MKPLPLKFECDMCDFACMKATQLVSHKHESHNVVPGEKIYKCDKCDYTGATLRNLKRHKNKQHTDTIVQCEHCSQTFKNKNALGMHKLRNHTGDAGLPCTLCPYKGKTSNDLKKHHLTAHEKIKAKVRTSNKLVPR